MISGIALFSAIAFILGAAVGAMIFCAIIEHFVRVDGHYTYRWGTRWYRVQGRNRP